MRFDALHLFQRSAIQQISRDAGEAEGVAGCCQSQLRFFAAPVDHPVDIDAVHAVVADAALLRHRAPQRHALAFSMPVAFSQSSRYSSVL